VKGTQNLTVALPTALVREAKKVAAKRETSVSALLRSHLEDLVERDRERDKAMERFLTRAAEGWDLGTERRIGWTRDELHER